MSEIAKLRWRCRRGMREMDLLLGGFLEQDYATANPELQASFVLILDEIDQDILDWVMHRQSPPLEYAALIEQLRAQQTRVPH